MKTLLFPLSLLLAASAGALPVVPVEYPEAGTIVYTPEGSGTAMGNGEVMGPLCPPSICPDPAKTDPSASAANALETISADGCTPWHPPCRSEAEQELPEIVVTGRRRSPPETHLNGGVVTATEKGQKGTDASGREIPDDEMRRLQAEATRLAGAGPTAGQAGPDPEDGPSDANLYGRGLGLDIGAMLAGNNDGLFPGSVASSIGASQTGTVQTQAWTYADVEASVGGRNDVNAGMRRTSSPGGALYQAGLANFGPEPATSNGTAEPEGCRNGGGDLMRGCASVQQNR